LVLTGTVAGLQRPAVVQVPAVAELQVLTLELPSVVKVWSLLVLVHAGVHFNAILGWLAVGAMLINVGSGLTGKFLLERSRRRMEEARQRLRAGGLPEAEHENQLYWDSLTFDAVKQWRVVHFPITLAFAVLATAHIVAVFLFWGWN
jgi:hypothetical protein